MMTYLIDVVNKEKKLVVGLMSGTSMDGIDAALVEIAGCGIDTKVRLIEFETFPYSKEEKNEIRSLCNPKTSSVDQICRMNVFLGQKMADAALKIISKGHFLPKDISFISSHGQTIYHMPETNSTLQIGELAVIAEETGCLTVGDFRPSDMAVGGQGAPLVPYTDFLLFQNKAVGRVLLNIGGISNITVLPKGCRVDEVYGFDTGPGNVLIDEMMKIGSNGRLSFDENGEIALKGTIHRRLLEQLLLKDSFIGQPAPKSTGRELYTLDMAREIWNDAMRLGISFSDVVSTVTQYTVEAVLLNLMREVLPKTSVSELIVSGGGAHNRALLKGLEKLDSVKVSKIEDIGFSSDAKEAISFAILGNECLHGSENNLPKVTGAKRQTIMGKIIFPGILKKEGNKVTAG